MDYTTLRVRTTDLRYALRALNDSGDNERSALRTLIGFATVVDAENIPDNKEAA